MNTLKLIIVLFVKKFVDPDYWVISKKIETNFKAPKVKVGDRIRFTKYKNIFSKDCTKNWPKETFVIDSVLKANPWNYKIKCLNGKKIIGSFYEKELFLSKL